MDVYGGGQSSPKEISNQETPKKGKAKSHQEKVAKVLVVCNRVCAPVRPPSSSQGMLKALDVLKAQQRATPLNVVLSSRCIALDTEVLKKTRIAILVRASTRSGWRDAPRGSRHPDAEFGDVQTGMELLDGVVTSEWPGSWSATGEKAGGIPCGPGKVCRGCRA